MSTATLQIVADAGAVRRTFAIIRSDSARVAQSIRADFQQVERQAVRSFDAIRAAATRAAIDRIRAEEQVSRVQEAAEREAVRMAEVGARARTAAERREYDQRAALVRRSAQQFAAAERSDTEVVRRETSRRTRLRREEGSGASGGASGRGRGGGGGGLSIGGVLGIVDRVANVGAEAGRMAYGAELELGRHRANLTDTLFQTTGDNREIAQRREELLRFGAESGLGFEAVSEAASAAQERFGALGNRQMTRQERGARMRTFLAGLEEAQALRTDPTQYAALAGALSNQGMGTGAVTSTMRSLVGMSQRGSVELGDLVQQGMGPLMASVQAAMAHAPAGANQEQVVREAVERTVAQMQVLDPLGISARRGGNALNAANASLGTRRTQAQLLTHLRDRFGADSALEQRLFTNGALNAQYQDAITLGSTLATATGNDPNALRNLLGTERGRNGRTMAQVLTQPQREALAALAGRGEGGRTGYQRLADIRAGGRDITAQTVEQGRSLRADEATTQEAKFSAMELMNKADNSTLVAQGRNQRAFEAQNPYANFAAQQVPGGQGVLQVSHWLETLAQRISGGIELGPHTLDQLRGATPAAQAQLARQAGASGGQRPPEAGR